MRNQSFSVFTNPHGDPRAYMADDYDLELRG